MPLLNKSPSVIMHTSRALLGSPEGLVHSYLQEWSSKIYFTDLKQNWEPP